MAFGEATGEHFEAALDAARADGDMSQENVLSKLPSRSRNAHPTDSPNAEAR